MTKHEFATKLFYELEEKHDVQKIVNSIKSAKNNGKNLSVNEQLEIVNLIREIHIKKTVGLFEGFFLTFGYTARFRFCQNINFPAKSELLAEINIQSSERTV